MTESKEMTPEELVAVRERCATCIDSATADVRTLLDHVDTITADRNEARQEVRALREQRDEIREAHRVELAAVKERLSTMKEAASWYLELRARHAGSNGAYAEEYANALRAAHDDLTSLVDMEPATARAAHLDALKARLEAAERSKVAHEERSHFWQRSSLDREAWLKSTEARADAAEAKLAALVEAAKYRPNPACPSCLGHGQVDLATNGIGNFVKARCASCRLSWEEGLRRAAQGEP